MVDFHGKPDRFRPGTSFSFHSVTYFILAASLAAFSACQAFFLSFFLPVVVQPDIHFHFHSWLRTTDCHRVVLWLCLLHMRAHHAAVGSDPDVRLLFLFGLMEGGSSDGSLGSAALRRAQRTRWVVETLARRRAQRMWLLQFHLTWCMQLTMRYIRNGRDRTLAVSHHSLLVLLRYSCTALCRVVDLLLTFVPPARARGVQVLRDYVRFTMAGRFVWLAHRLNNHDHSRQSIGAPRVFERLTRSGRSTPAAIADDMDTYRGHGPLPRAGPPAATPVANQYLAGHRRVRARSRAVTPQVPHSGAGPSASEEL